MPIAPQLDAQSQVSTTQELKLISEITHEILSTFDIQRILDISIQRIVGKLNLLGGILFLVDGDTLNAKTIAGGSKAKDFIRLIEKPVNKLSVSITRHTDNLVVDTVRHNRINQSPELYKFTTGVLNWPVTMVAQRITSTKACISLPLAMGGNTIGAVFFSKASGGDFNDEIPMLRLLSSHLAIAMTNAKLYSLLDKKAQALEASISEIKELRRQEKDMLAVLSHEIKTPLTSILGSLELLNEKAQKIFPAGDKEGDYCRKLINMALTSTNKERELTEKLLSVTRVEEAAQMLNLEKVNLSELVTHSYEMHGPVAKAKNLKLILRSPARQVFVSADPLRLHEIMENLLSNAIKYTPTGSITIQLVKYDHFATIRVTDTGIGVHKDDLPDLGKKFFRSRHNYSRHKMGSLPGGTGLGLYIVSNYLESMGSKLKVTSKLNKGTTFEFSLPLRR